MWFPGDGRDGRPWDRRPPAIMGPRSLDDSFVISTPRGAPRRVKRAASGVPLVERLWGIRGDSSEDTVTCIACGRSVTRDEAREYDRYGNRWNRENKSFEYLCKPCHGDLDHQPRDELEGLLVEVDAGERTREEFLNWYCNLVLERYGPLEED